METEVIIQCSGRNAEERFTVDFGKIFKGDKGDTGEGVPAGGRTGQVLKKKSDGDYDTTWGDDEGITDIAPGAVGTEEIAEKAVTLPKLGDDVAAKLNGYASKEDVAAVAAVATSAASVAADAQTLADDAANDAQTAVNTANDAKTAAENAQTAASGAVRYDAAQELTVAQQEQVFGNLGLKVVYIAEAEFGTVLNTERFDEILATDIAITEYQGKEYIFMTGNDTAPNERYYTSPFSPMLFLRFYVSYRTKVLASPYLQRIVDTGAVSYLNVQTLTSAEQTKGRTNIDGMKNTPSGDPMHYIYETAGAEWIPYADISTDGLEDWQVETLNMTQAQADGGAWWHNGIFVTVEQNRINYVLTSGHYPANTPDYKYYLCNVTTTTNYKQLVNITDSRAFNTTINICNKLVAVMLPNIRLSQMVYSFMHCPQLAKIFNILDVSAVSSFNNVFVACSNLRDISLKGLKANLDWSGAPKLSMTSIAYAITNAGTASFTITLAATVYTAAMADADVQAALAAKPNVTLADAGTTSSGEN